MADEGRLLANLEVNLAALVLKRRILHRDRIQVAVRRHVLLHQVVLDVRHVLLESAALDLNAAGEAVRVDHKASMVVLREDASHEVSDSRTASCCLRLKV